MYILIQVWSQRKTNRSKQCCNVFCKVRLGPWWLIIIKSNRFCKFYWMGWFSVAFSIIKKKSVYTVFVNILKRFLFFSLSEYLYILYKNSVYFGILRELQSKTRSSSVLIVHNSFIWISLIVFQNSLKIIYIIFSREISYKIVLAINTFYYLWRQSVKFVSKFRSPSKSVLDCCSNMQNEEYLPKFNYLPHLDYFLWVYMFLTW